MPKTASELLLDAAALGEKVGVSTGGEFLTSTGSMCIKGLMVVAILDDMGLPLPRSSDTKSWQNMANMGWGDPDPVVSPVFIEMENLVKQELGSGCYHGDIAIWNNIICSPERTIAVLRAAADLMILID